MENKKSKTAFTVNELEAQFHKDLCNSFKLNVSGGDHISIQTPFYFPNGDSYQIYLKHKEGDTFCITDRATTVGQIFHIQDTYERKEKELLTRICKEYQIEEHDGELHIWSVSHRLVEDVMRLAQAIKAIVLYTTQLILQNEE